MHHKIRPLFPVFCGVLLVTSVASAEDAALGVEKVYDRPAALGYGATYESYFGAFLLDPFGNRIEAVCHRAE